MAKFFHLHEILSLTKRVILGIPVATSTKPLRDEVGSSPRITRDMNGYVLIIKQAVLENKKNISTENAFKEIQEEESKP